MTDSKIMAGIVPNTGGSSSSSARDRQRLSKEYERLELVGAGSFAKVYRGIWVSINDEHSVNADSCFRKKTGPWLPSNLLIVRR